jgi:hypothetical protein
MLPMKVLAGLTSIPSRHPFSYVLHAILIKQQRRQKKLLIAQIECLNTRKPVA